MQKVGVAPDPRVHLHAITQVRHLQQSNDHHPTTQPPHCLGKDQVCLVQHHSSHGYL